MVGLAASSARDHTVMARRRKSGTERLACARYRTIRRPNVVLGGKVEDGRAQDRHGPSVEEPGATL
jgi:hypothetical protein